MVKLQDMLRRAQTGAAVMAVILGSGATVNAQDAAVPDDPIAQRSRAIDARYAPQFNQLRSDAEELGKDRPSDIGATVGVDVKVGSHRETIVLGVPEFWMGKQRIVLKVPEVAMRQQKWIYDTPSVRMKRVQVGVHPEWHGPLHMEWKANYMDVPEPFMQRQVTILNVPEFKMGTQTIILHLPQVAIRQQRWSFDVPDITVKDVHAETGRMKDRADALQTRGQSLSKQMKAEINQMLLEELPKKRALIVAQFDDSEKRLTAAIAEARKFNMDTSKPLPDGAPALDEVLRSLQASRASSLQTLDEQTAQAQAASAS
jgi:hypothetical protein